MRHIIVGDIHGCLDELNALIRRVGVRSEDIWVIAGDVVDKGPDSAGCVKRLKVLSEETNVVVLRGNHELNHEKYLRALEAQKKFGTKIKMPQRKLDVIIPIQEGLSDEDRKFLFSGPLYHRIPVHNVLVVHAGILPTTPELPEWEDFESLDRSKRSAIELHVTRGRFVRGEDRVVLKLTANVLADMDVAKFEVGDSFSVADGMGMLTFKVDKSHLLPAGEFVSLGKEEVGDKFWAEMYDGRYGHIYFGHQPFLRKEPIRFPHATALDLGCVHGNRLAAVVLIEDEEPEIMTIDAAKCYSRQLNASWLPKVPGFDGDDS
ncbi:serine/threonine protein phosphatase [Candidatus Bathyarchaeota archaeon]|jgi:serine/threonine protein phosphatase 1|nr:serine/threonine protein phosphatase [Candidatus Bathyarchaeota archaeon]